VDSFSTDVWRLGCIIYELIALYPPFNHQDKAILKQVLLNYSIAPKPFVYSNYHQQVVNFMLVKYPSRRIRIEDLQDLPFLSKINTNLTPLQYNYLGFKHQNGIDVLEDFSKVINVLKFQQKQVIHGDEPIMVIL
jgi:serine/threonine protein kinase